MVPPSFAKRIDPQVVVLVLVLGFCIAGIFQLVRDYPNAGRGMLIFAREQKDLFVDQGLVAESYRVRANPSLAKLLRAETVIVGTRTSPHEGYLGAGVIVGLHGDMLTVLTAKHIIAHAGRKFVVFPNYTGRFTSRIVPDPNHDLALVYVRGMPGETYTIAQVSPESFSSGQRFVVMGHPGSGSWVASPGVAEKHLHATLLFCPTCERGDSGAGAFDSTGMLRGIVVTKEVIIAPSAKDGSDFRLTAFEIEQPKAIRALLRGDLKN